MGTAFARESSWWDILLLLDKKLPEASTEISEICFNYWLISLLSDVRLCFPAGQSVFLRAPRATASWLGKHLMGAILTRWGWESMWPRRARAGQCRKRDRCDHGRHWGSLLLRKQLSVISFQLIAVVCFIALQHLHLTHSHTSALMTPFVAF